MAKVTVRRDRGPEAATAPTPSSNPAPHELPAQNAAESVEMGLDNTLARFIASIPNFRVRDLGRLKISGGSEAEQFEVTFGEPTKKAQIRTLDVADEWDLAEVAGEASKSEQWMMMAKAAASVVAIDQNACLPGRAGYSRDYLRRVMRDLGVVGVNAVSAVQAGMRPSPAQADPVATAKNS